MSDATPSTRDFLGTADDELIFDEALPVEIAVPVAAQTETAEPRRVPRRGRKSVGKAAPPEPVPASSLPPRSAEGDPPAAEEPAGAPAPFPPLGANPAGSKSHPLLLAIVGFALLTSTVSLGGLIAVGRTLSHADSDRNEAASERQALADVPTLVAHLDAASAKLDASAARSGTSGFPAPLPMSGSAPAITIADLHHEIDALKLSLGEHQPEGLVSLDNVLRGGFTEMTGRIDRLSAQLDRIERRGGGSSGGAVSASRPASRAVGPRQPS